MTMSRATTIRNDLIKGLQKNICFGVSKYGVKVAAREEYLKNGGSPDGFLHAQGLYAHKSYKTYRSDIETFAKWAAQNTNARDGASARQYVPNYLKLLIEKGLAAPSIYKYAHALACSYGCKAADFGIALPRRERSKITRSRKPVKSDSRFTSKKCEDARNFARGTGCRYRGLTTVRANDIRPREGGGYEVFFTEKGGKKRWARVLPQYEEFVLERFREAKTRGEDALLFPEIIDHHVDIHACRGEYARAAYALYESEGYATGEEYVCEMDRYGDVYDKGVLLMVSRDLGHNRCDVVVNDYMK